MSLIRNHPRSVLKQTYAQMKAKQPYQIHSQIRENARRIYKRTGVSRCEVCGYDKHIEVCHIKAIHLHHDHQTVEEINDPAN
jgi:hypothetical protein